MQKSSNSNSTLKYYIAEVSRTYLECQILRRLRQEDHLSKKKTMSSKPQLKENFLNIINNMLKKPVINDMLS
jgi:hypothetical protein